jgi:hypothetical protein
MNFKLEELKAAPTSTCGLGVKHLHAERASLGRIMIAKQSFGVRSVSCALRCLLSA